MNRYRSVANGTYGSMVDHDDNSIDIICMVLHDCIVLIHHDERMPQQQKYRKKFSRCIKKTTTSSNIIRVNITLKRIQTMIREENVDMSRTFPLHPVLRLIHCLQRERGASCAMAGFRANSTPDVAIDCSPCVEGVNRHPYSRNVQSARVATNTAIFSFYKRCFGSTAIACEDFGRRLIEIRNITEGALNESKVEFDVEMSDQMYYFHQVLSEYNSFLAFIIQKYVVDILKERTKYIATLSNADSRSCTRRDTALSLLNFLLSFVRLKESLGIERAILSGIMAIGLITSSQVNLDDSARTEHCIPRLPIIVNDLVMVVENQRHIIRGLEKQAALNVHSWSASDISEAAAIDENYCSLLRLVGESIKLSDEMHILQNRIRQDFDVNGLHQVNI